MQTDDWLVSDNQWLSYIPKLMADDDLSPLPYYEQVLWLRVIPKHPDFVIATDLLLFRAIDSGNCNLELESYSYQTPANYPIEPLL